jgi:predicted RNA-binding Zn-ribbon protein involved in translation (DUF1610 family)
MYSIGDEAALCPNCGSRNVRWRNRRFYDVILTWLRYFADAFLSMIFSRGATPTVGMPYGDRVLQSRVSAELYKRARSAYEMKIGLTTAVRFWRCPECKQKGQVFSGIDDALTEGRTALASVEDEITGGLGSVSTPVDRDGLSDN